MKWFIFLLALVNYAHAQTQPDEATLRPTTTDAPTPPTDMPTIDPALLPKTSGEPERVVTVSMALLLMVALTIGGICIVAYGGDECNDKGTSKRKRYSKVRNKQNPLW